jgi:phosphoribosylanthranilate isomerase
MKLRNVSITGADDLVSLADLNEVAWEYPFVEWAILLLPELAGDFRAPSEKWIRAFALGYEGEYLAMHLCGNALTGFVEGKRDILDLMKGFNRIQLNLEFGNVEGKYDPEKLIAQIKAHPEFEFIIQYTDKRREMLPKLAGVANHSILFDASAGRGVAPEGWPAPIPGHFCGYAGGIGPGNVTEHLEKIAVAGAQETWIDMESGVRTNDRFDLDKVRAVLKIAEPFVKK